MMRYKAHGTKVFDTSTGECARYLSEYGALNAALRLNYEEVGREELYWESPRFVVEGKTLIDLVKNQVAPLAYESIAETAALGLNTGHLDPNSSMWDWEPQSKVGEEAPRYVVDSTEPDCYKVRDTTSSRYAPFSTAGGARRTAANLNGGGDDNYYAWMGDATHEELSRKDDEPGIWEEAVREYWASEADSEPELEEWERELLASCGIVEIPEKLYSAEAYTDEVDNRTYGIVRDSSNDTFAPMNSPFDAAMWAQRLNADKMESRKLSWLDGEPSDYFE